jgi:hypothetical protein
MSLGSPSSSLSLFGDALISQPCSDRRPAGLSEHRPVASNPSVRYLERQAYLEAAASEAFERFACELISFGAPAKFVDEAMRFRADEARHHERVVALGRGLDPAFSCPPPQAPLAKRRSLYAFAFENAVEGCVRETWGALLARYQAKHAPDEAMRAAFACIALDERRHAELAWSVHEWLSLHLSGVGRQEMRDTMASAVLYVLDEYEADGLSPEVRAQLGLPSPDEARSMLLKLRQALFIRPLAA